jgi:hypothetical protein
MTNFKKIKAMEKDISVAITHNVVRNVFNGNFIGVDSNGMARELYDKGYEKRSQAEWLDAEEYYVCSNCNHDDEYMTNYCSECGAEMKARR